MVDPAPTALDQGAAHPPMPIAHDVVGVTAPGGQVTWASADALLYAVGVGAGTDDLAFTTENTSGVRQRALPTMAAVLSGAAMRVVEALGPFDPAGLVHGAQQLDLPAELPVEATVETAGTIVGLWDKGSGAVVEIEVVATDLHTGELRFRSLTSLFLRGEGGWGGDRGPSAAAAPADRPPDHVVTLPTNPDQALLYRLNGDRNPLHSDPAFAARAGFPRPILHGLCTYAIAGRALLRAVCEGDPGRLRSIAGRFSAPVFPGESLTTHVWDPDPTGAARFVTLGPDGRVVLSAGSCRAD
jgi:acyl dehydratase